MKQVWILNHYARGPDNAGLGITRHFHLAQYLKPLGWESTLIAASVDHATGRQRLAVREKFRLEVLHGVRFLWLNTPTYRGNGGARIRNMLIYTWRALCRSTVAGLPRPDVVVGSSVHPFAAFAGAMLARRYRVPFIFEVRDLWPQTLIDMGKLNERGVATWILRKLELWLYRRAKRIIVLLPNAWEYIESLGIPKSKIDWIPNGVDLSLFKDVKPVATSGNRYFTFMYFGAHGAANDLSNVLKAMSLLKDAPYGESIKLRLIGDGPCKQSLMKQAQALDLRNVSFEPPVPKNAIPDLAAQADAFIFNLIDAKIFRYGVSPNKLFDYMASMRPIIFCCNSVNNPVAQAEAGISVPPNDPRLLANAMAQLVAAPANQRLRMGTAGRAYVERSHGFERLAIKFSKTLDLACSVNS